jgi:hypothetical protein
MNKMNHHEPVLPIFRKFVENVTCITRIGVRTKKYNDEIAVHQHWRQWRRPDAAKEFTRLKAEVNAIAQSRFRLYEQQSDMTRVHL